MQKLLELVNEYYGWDVKFLDGDFFMNWFKLEPRVVLWYRFFRRLLDNDKINVDKEWRWRWETMFQIPFTDDLAAFIVWLLK